MALVLCCQDISSAVRELRPCTWALSSDHDISPAVEEEEDEETKAQAPKAAIKVDAEREDGRHSGVIPAAWWA